MDQIIVKTAPIILIFLLGIGVRRVGLFTRENADVFLKVVFYLSFPALSLTSITNVKLDSDYALLPFLAAGINLITYGAAKFVERFFNLPRPTNGVFLIGSAIINTGFLFPFIIAVYGDEGLARAVVFDLGNSFLVLSFIYFIACRYGTVGNRKGIFKKMIVSPPLLALVAALALNLAGLKLPLVLFDLAQAVGSMAIPLAILSAGIYFSPRVVRVGPLLSVIGIRMALGGILGVIFIMVFRLEGLDRAVVLILSAAPVGYTTLTFAAMENLDKDFAAVLLSFSFLISIITTPVLMSVLALKNF